MIPCLSVPNRQTENISKTFDPVGLLKYAVIAITLVAIMPHAYAQDLNYEVRILKGSAESQVKTFYPDILPINPGDSITWINEDSVAHSITSGVPEHQDYSGQYFKTGIIEPSKSVTLKIDKPIYIAYYYFCEIHPWLEGKIVMENTPEAQPETDNVLITQKSYSMNQDILVSGQVSDDFATLSYSVLLYENPDKLIYARNGNFEKDASYMQTIQTDGLQAGTYLLKLVYGLPTQVATTTFEITQDKTAPIPSWIKEGARWWADGTISDNEFIDAVEFLAKEKIITIQQTGATSSEFIPSWVKTNAGWWADGMISDKEFTRSLQYLVNSGIIKIGSVGADQ
jgi:plastocyanin